MSEDLIQRLKPWIHKPTVTVPILEFIEASEQPVTLKEIMAGAGTTRGQTARTLERLATKGLVARRKVPITVPHGVYPGKTATFQQFIYYRPEKA